MSQRNDDISNQVKGMTFINELLSQFNGVEVEHFEGGYSRISFEIELSIDPTTIKTVQLMVKTDIGEDTDYEMDARMTSVRIENKNSIHFQNTSYLDELDKKLDIAIKKAFTFRQLFELIDQEIRD